MSSPSTRRPRRRTSACAARVTVPFAIAGLVVAVGPCRSSPTRWPAASCSSSARTSADSQAFNNARFVQDRLRTRRLDRQTVSSTTSAPRAAASPSSTQHRRPLVPARAPPGSARTTSRRPCATPSWSATAAASATRQRRSVPRHRRVRGRQRRRLLRGVPDRQPAADAERHRHARWPSAPRSRRSPRRRPRLVGQPAPAQPAVARRRRRQRTGRGRPRHPPARRSPTPTSHRLVSSFNDMADAVQDRIEREARFASDVSHELRSPLTALTAAVEVLDAPRTTCPSAPSRRSTWSSARCAASTRWCSTCSRSPASTPASTEFHPEPVSSPDVGRRIAARYGFDDVPVRRPPPGRAPVLARQAPARAHPRQPPRQRQAARRRPHPHRHRRRAAGTVRLVVEDAGPGVPRVERTRIFERFARGTAARDRVGTGLGLALVAEHAAVHGGSAWVEDRPGGGARFVVSFPADVAGRLRPGARWSAVARSPAAAPALAGLAADRRASYTAIQPDRPPLRPRRHHDDEHTTTTTSRRPPRRPRPRPPRPPRSPPRRCRSTSC